MLFVMSVDVFYELKVLYEEIFGVVLLIVWCLDLNMMFVLVELLEG